MAKPRSRKASVQREDDDDATLPDFFDLLPDVAHPTTTPSVRATNGQALTRLILHDFGVPVAATPAQIRNLVINKLIVESDNPSPGIRVRALELLGKVRDVGLFAERADVTITHQTTAELRDKLHAKLVKLRLAAMNEPIEVISEPEMESKSPKTPDLDTFDIMCGLDLFASAIKTPSATLPWASA